MQVAQRRHPMLYKSDKNGLVDAVQSRYPVLDSPIPLW